MNHNAYESSLIDLQRECETRVRELMAQKEEFTNTCTEIKQRGNAKNREAKDIKSEIDSLNSQEGQKLAQLRNMAPEVAAAYVWLQEHKDEFEKEVFGPAFLTCSIKDKRYSHLVQSGLNKDDLFCFVAQNKSDHRKLTNQFYNKMNTAVSIRTIVTDLSAFVSPVTKDAVTELGLDGFAMDFIEGPRPVLAMLCSEKKIHLTGVALKDISAEQYERLENGGRITSFAAGKTYHRITRRREYGPEATSTLTKNIQPGRWWTDEPMDTSAKAQLEQRLMECRREVAGMKEEWESANAKVDEVKEQIQGVEKEQVRHRVLQFNRMLRLT